MSHIINVNRRRFLKATGVAGGAFILGLQYQAQYRCG